MFFRKFRANFEELLIFTTASYHCVKHVLLYNCGFVWNFKFWLLLKMLYKHNIFIKQN